MLSKSSGQILRVSAAIHVLFHLENDEPLPNIIAPSAIESVSQSKFAASTLLTSPDMEQSIMSWKF